MSTRPLEQVTYYSPKYIGRSFFEIDDEELIEAPEKLQCQWYHSPYDADLIIWSDMNGVFVRLHFCFLGLTLDWDLMNGTQTGYITENSEEHLTHSIFGEISYDSEVSGFTLNHLVAIVGEIAAMGTEKKDRVVEYFQKSPTFSKIAGTRRDTGVPWQEFVGMLRKFFK